MCGLSPLAFSHSTFTQGVVHVDAIRTKIEVIPAWNHKLPRLQQMRKLQDLENSRSCRRATFGKFQILPARFGKFKILLARLGKFKILRQDFENSRSCRQDLESLNFCRQYWKILDPAARFGKFKILQLTTLNSPLLTYHLVKLTCMAEVKEDLRQTCGKLLT